MRRLLASRGVWVVVGALLLWSLGRIAVRGLARDPRFDALPDVTRVTGPAWGGDVLVAPVREALLALGPVNLFDARFEERIRRALAQVPVIRSVNCVRRLWPRRYAVEFTFHRPVAVVRRGDERIAITWEGVALPYGPCEEACRGLLEIDGVQRAPPAYGRVWRSERLLDALATLEQIAPHLASLAPLGLSRIDVSESPDPRRGVVLMGGDGIRVRWGRPRSTVGENPVDRKIRYLGIAASNLAQVRGFEIEVRYGDFYLRESPVDEGPRASSP